MVRLILLDVEGVIALPGGSQMPWPLETLLEIRRVLARAPAGVGLCTGRQEPYGEALVQALSLFRPLPAEVRDRVREVSGESLVSWPSIMENGAYYYDPMAKRAFPHPALTPERVAVLHRIRAELVVPFVRATGALLEAGKDFSLSLNPPLLSPEGTERQLPVDFRPVVEEALSTCADLLEIHHTHSAIDITPRGVSKAIAVETLLEWTCLQPNEVLGVGDTRADEKWLKLIGWRAAPANGREALPGLEYYSPFEVADGLLDILQHLESNGFEGLA